MKWKLATAAVVLTATGLSANALYSRRADAAPEVIAEPVTRGSIVQTVAASGTLEAVTTVLVGTQISGTVDSLYADFNTIVKKGQVIARLDPSLVKPKSSASTCRSLMPVSRRPAHASSPTVS
jgi:HlyD family secretion protein